MKPNPVRWFEIYVQDMSRAVKFYESVFQLKLEKLENPDSHKQPGAPAFEYWSFPLDKDAAGCGGALAKMDGVASGGGGTLVYFACADCSVEAERVRRSGGAVRKDKFSIHPYGYIALVTDTEGNLIGLHSME